MTNYFDELAAQLRARSVPPERIAVTIDDLAAYLRESGTGPEEEFGPAAAFAPLLAVDSPAPTGDTWVWTADIFIDQRRLNEFGAQGWEVEDVDERGMFVSRRDPDHPQRWEYRREVKTPELAGRLALDGWEPCGTWWRYVYFKRPVAARVGPAAEIDSPPPAPTGRVFLSRRFFLLAALMLAVGALGVAAIGWALSATTPIEAGDFAAGAAFGAVAAAVAVFLALRRRP